MIPLCFFARRVHIWFFWFQVQKIYLFFNFVIFFFLKIMDFKFVDDSGSSVLNWSGKMNCCNLRSTSIQIIAFYSFGKDLVTFALILMKLEFCLDGYKCLKFKWITFMLITVLTSWQSFCIGWVNANYCWLSACRSAYYLRWFCCLSLCFYLSFLF